MIKIYSLSTEGLLAHAIHKIDEFHGRQNIIHDSEFIQIATLELKEKDSFLPHVHLWKDIPNDRNVAQESWVVIRGKVEVNFYDIDGAFLEQHILNEGECSISLHGGHSYKALSNSLVYEFKNGPYLGQEMDKTFIQ